MTRNQLTYHANLETMRANRESEAIKRNQHELSKSELEETKRANLKNEEIKSHQAHSQRIAAYGTLLKGMASPMKLFI